MLNVKDLSNSDTYRYVIEVEYGWNRLSFQIEKEIVKTVNKLGSTKTNEVSEYYILRELKASKECNQVTTYRVNQNPIGERVLFNSLGIQVEEIESKPYVIFFDNPKCIDNIRFLPLGKKEEKEYIITCSPGVLICDLSTFTDINIATHSFKDYLLLSSHQHLELDDQRCAKVLECKEVLGVYFLGIKYQKMRSNLDIWKNGSPQLISEMNEESKKRVIDYVSYVEDFRSFNNLEEWLQYRGKTND